MVIDTEDGILASELEGALERISTLLNILSPVTLLRFIRPRDPQTLERLLAMEGIGAIDGFVLPKFGVKNAQHYLSLVRDTPFVFMPSIEGDELFDPIRLSEIREMLLPYRPRIPLIRFGAEDMLSQLGLRRDCSRSLFEMSAPSYAIGALLSLFKPYGFDISGGVFRCYQDHEGFRHDLLRDLSEGLVSKTIIHPDQIDLIELCYRVTSEELDEAQRLLAAGSAVFSLNGTMGEAVTQHKWAENILIRSSHYNVQI